MGIYMDIITDYVNKIFDNKYTSTILTMFLVLYGGLAAPKLPIGIKNLFKNSVFRIMILSLIVYNGNKNPKVSLIIAVIFLISMQQLSNSEVEKFSSNSDNCYLTCMTDTISYLKNKDHDN